MALFLTLYRFLIPEGVQAHSGFVGGLDVCVCACEVGAVGCAYCIHRCCCCCGCGGGGPRVTLLLRIDVKINVWMNIFLVHDEKYGTKLKLRLVHESFRDECDISRCNTNLM